MRTSAAQVDAAATEPDGTEEGHEARDMRERRRRVLVEPGGDAFIKKTRGRIPRHVFGDVTKPPARGENYEQPNREMQSEVAFRRKPRLEKTNLPREAATRWLTHVLSFTNPTVLRAVEALDGQNIQ